MKREENQCHVHSKTPFAPRSLHGKTKKQTKNKINKNKQTKQGAVEVTAYSNRDCGLHFAFYGR